MVRLFGHGSWLHPAQIIQCLCLMSAFNGNRAMLEEPAGPSGSPVGSVS